MTKDGYQYFDKWSDSAIEQEIMRIEGAASYTNDDLKTSQRKLRALKRRRNTRIKAGSWTGGVDGADS